MNDCSVFTLSCLALVLRQKCGLQALMAKHLWPQTLWYIYCGCFGIWTMVAVKSIVQQ